MTQQERKKSGQNPELVFETRPLSQVSDLTTNNGGKPELKNGTPSNRKFFQ